MVPGCSTPWHRLPGMSKERRGARGVFAAEGPGTRLEAKAEGSEILLTGAKPWCSLAPLEPAWVARGLREIPSGAVHFSQVPAVPLGGDGRYFRRPGFGWGGMGVAACWLGGAVAVARDYKESLRAASWNGREPDQVALAALGEMDRILTSALQYLARTAELIDGGDLSIQGRGSDGADTTGAGRSAWSEALRVRGTIAAAVERVLYLASSNLGPAPLVFDEPYAKRMADLTLYIRQHHAMRDDSQLGNLTLKREHSW